MTVLAIAVSLVIFAFGVLTGIQFCNWVDRMERRDWRDHI